MALEVRSWKLGFVVFEGAKLLEFGIRRWRARDDAPAIAGTKIGRVLTAYQPDTLVIRKRRMPWKYARPLTTKLIAGIRREAKRRSIGVKSIPTKVVQDFFGIRGGRTKQAIFAMLGEWFEELTWKVPRKRKRWHSEPHNVVIFDAAATAIAFLAGE